MTLRACVKCGVPKNTKARCKPCWTAYRRNWRANNSELNREASRKQYQKNPAKALEYTQTWRAKNPARVKENERKRYALDSEKERLAAYKASHVSNYRAYAALRRARIKAAVTGSLTVSVTSEQWEGRLLVYGHRCAYCGRHQDTVGTLHRDHVKPLSLGGPHILSNLRPACKNCNSRKRNMPALAWLKLLRVQICQH